MVTAQQLKEALEKNISSLQQYIASKLADLEAQLKSEYDSFKADILGALDETKGRVEVLSAENAALKLRLLKLESSVDENAQYERRDTLIISGPVVPAPLQNEYSSSCRCVLCKLIQDTLKINLDPATINTCHLLKPTASDHKIIPNFASATKKRTS